MKREQQQLNHDMQVAEQVLDLYGKNQDRKDLSIHKITCNAKMGLTVTRADWVVALEEEFERQYGYEQGIEVTNKIITKILINGRTSH